MRRLFRLVLLVVLPFALGSTIGPLGGASAAPTPVEPYAPYQPRTVCSAWDKPGTKVLARWMATGFGGRYGGISRACTGRSVSEHREGRAFDWTLNAYSSADRMRAVRLIQRLRATGPSGEPAELARRMGVMYIIFNDRM